MAQEPDRGALDLATLAAQHVEQAEGGFCETCGSLWEWPCAVRALLTAYDAQAARLAAVEPVVQAAEAWVAVFVDAPVQEPWLTPWRALHDAVADYWSNNGFG